MPLVGIPLEILLTMIVAAFGIPFIVVGFLYFVWVPKPSKSFIKAKLLKRHVDIDANDMGILGFEVGRIQGPGVFSNKENFITFIPRIAESWVNKTFSADGIRTILSYSGKAVCGSPEMMAVIELNKLFAAEKAKEENKNKKPEDLFNEFVEKHPEATTLLKGLHEAKVAWEEEVNGKKNITRKVAIILDQRNLRSYISKNVGGAQLKYLGKINYNRGVAETESPMTKFKGIFIIILIGLIVAAAVAVILLLSSGGSVQVPGV